MLWLSSHHHPLRLSSNIFIAESCISAFLHAFPSASNTFPQPFCWYIWINLSSLSSNATSALKAFLTFSGRPLVLSLGFHNYRHSQLKHYYIQTMINLSSLFFCEILSVSVWFCYLQTVVTLCIPRR